jgi:hypothetical protein
MARHLPIATPFQSMVFIFILASCARTFRNISVELVSLHHYGKLHKGKYDIEIKIKK